MLLLMRMEAADKAAHDFAPNFDSLTPRRKAVLVDMAYNMGRDGLFGFRRLQTALSRDDYDGASAEIVDSKYWRDLDTRPRATLNARIMRDG